MSITRSDRHPGAHEDDWRQGGWSFRAEGTLPAGTRFWVAVDDQPANPWDARPADRPAPVTPAARRSPG
ncbi:hypothetical protein [Catenuloplanes atrovinosus]|uniref:Uncharacterized protein n=1 Tax=Catenuloplanes atrovinosus TaxID=137266 RepID=A0AAE4C974_9ACTN|nr:hypothetical protein [Catenuloplanes atrovinosus]MDR7275758.1 hypothetical protein [Catenuloplanes atrovinosus]